MRLHFFIVILITTSLINEDALGQYNFNVKRPLSEINHKIVFASFSQDGKYIVTAGSDSSIILWNADRLTIYRTLTGLTARPNVAYLSSDNRYVLAGGKDNKISMWDLEIMPPAIGKTFKGHKGQIKTIDLSPDGKYLASGSADGTIRIWDLLSTNLVYELKEHKKDVNSIRFSPDGKTLVSGGADGLLILWNISNGGMIASTSAHKGWIRDIVFSPDGTLLASCGDDKLINIWQMPELKKSGTLEGHKDWVLSIDFTPDGKNLLSGSRDRLLILWDVTTSKILRESTKQVQTVNTVDISPVKSDFISSCYNSEDLEIWALSGLDESQWRRSGVLHKPPQSDNMQKVTQEQNIMEISDAAGQSQNKPLIELFSPIAVQGRILLDKTSISLIGRVTDREGIVSFRINGFNVKLTDDGIFQNNVTLTKGENNFILVAVNNNGIPTEQKMVVDCIALNASAPGEIVPEIMNGRYFALLIGVNEYIDPDIPDLANPVKDAESLRNVLESKYTFEKKNIILLKNPTNKDLMGTLDSLAAILASDDNLLIFYAGHGRWDEKGKVGAWFPSDASKNNSSNWFRNSTLRDCLSSIATKHTLLIADACFSGSILKTRAITMEPSKGIEKLYKLPSRKAMTSGITEEVPDESVFLKYLVNRLSDNEEKFLPSEVLFSSFKPAVMDNSPNTPQFGVIQNVGDEGGDFIFIKK